MDFIELGRVSIEQADGGQATWDIGHELRRGCCADSPYLHQVEALYQAAGLNLSADLATLTAHTTIKADPAALRSLYRTSVPTGRLEVPELDLHTIGDNLVPVQNENYYRQLVDRAGSGDLLRQAYTEQLRALQLQPVRAGRGRPGGPAAGHHRALGQRRDRGQPGAGGRRHRTSARPASPLPPRAR